MSDDGAREGVAGFELTLRAEQDLSGDESKELEMRQMAFSPWLRLSTVVVHNDATNAPI